MEVLGRDLRLSLDLISADLTVSSKGDLNTVADVDNLAQAILARLSTDQGELEDIGHADYGSRLYEVMGEVNNAVTRQRIKSLVMECLDQEPRIAKIISVNVLTAPKDPHRADVELTIAPIESAKYLTISYPFSLEG